MAAVGRSGSESVFPTARFTPGSLLRPSLQCSIDGYFVGSVFSQKPAGVDIHVSRQMLYMSPKSTEKNGLCVLACAGSGMFGSSLGEMSR